MGDIADASNSHLSYPRVAYLSVNHDSLEGVKQPAAGKYGRALLTTHVVIEQPLVLRSHSKAPAKNNLSWWGGMSKDFGRGIWLEVCHACSDHASSGVVSRNDKSEFYSGQFGGQKSGGLVHTYHWSTSYSEIAVYSFEIPVHDHQLTGLSMPKVLVWSGMDITNVEPQTKN